MRIHGLLISMALVMAVACSSPRQSADVKADVRTALDRAGLKEVSVDQDRVKGIVTLSGKVPTEGEKTQAAALAQAIAAGQVVANEINVTPTGMESEATEAAGLMDDAIESNMKALLVGKRFAEDVSYEVRARVVRLTGTVSSQAERDDIAKLAASVPNVVQVVNELEVTNQKATSRKP
jgi:hyperosmotically inducible periplasmic protein